MFTIIVITTTATSHPSGASGCDGTCSGSRSNRITTIRSYTHSIGSIRIIICIRSIPPT